MSWLKIVESKWFTVFFFSFSFVILFTISDHYFGWTNKGPNSGRMVRSDAAGYYGYMPQWFIYNTSNFEFIDSIAKEYPNDGFEDNYGRTASGAFTNKYFCGTAALSSPFFLIGHLHAKIYGAAQDGYSWPYLLWVNIGSIVYTLLGVFGLLLIGLRWGFSKWKIYLTLILLLYGTNLFYYTTIDIPYSHVYCYALVIWMLYALIRWKDNPNSKWKWLFFIFVSLAIIVRPTNVLALAFAPFLWENWKTFQSWVVLQIKVYWKSNLVGFILASLILFLQVYNVYSQYGLVQFNVYVNEGFDHWKNPYILETLFGFNKGMFIYSPVLLLILPGLYFLFKWNRYRFMGFLLTFGVITYVISSWWCWWYGGAFGLRAYIDFYGVFAIPMLVLIEKVNKWGLLFLTPILIVSIYLHQTFDTQYKSNIILYDGMSYEKFKLIFLKTEPRYNWLCSRNIDTLSPAFEEHGRVATFYDPKLKKEVNYFNFKDKFDGSLPTVTIHIPKNENNSDRLFAYRFNGSAKIHGNGVYLSLVTTGFKNGNKIFELDHPYSHVPDKIATWCNVSCDVESGCKISDLDSINIKFYYTATYSEIKIDNIIWGSDKKLITP